ncbi:class I SAM-dependent methyltransferase [Actinopolymorpha singaporensis]|uniref:Predicted SAM-depedendent methyltransferase n=1 Tax=Actinopolymorpha singaporensis TaxID=117157 RepID=A0A1H1UTP1_9ACTN|nr:methyltransferase domain-containing protein [Actinopolymorpha singaporensis]SDS75958.1 Predicted SAM-depedendent methyltransferase [Actinopolymorpha singaporensis]
MNLRHVLKQSDAMVGLVHDSRKMLRIPALVRRRRIIDNYLATHGIRRLQIGAGRTSLDGWLSTDISPGPYGSVFLDASKAFPFDDAVFDTVYSEHMIEHISWDDGLFMLSEIRRVLKPGGVVRIATPDLAVLLSLYGRDQSALGEKYVRWITDEFLPQVDVYDASFVINNAFRNWGHQFLYDGNLMEMAMSRAGFADIRRCSPGESSHADLRAVESHGKHVADEEMAAFETMVYEGARPR